MDYYLVEININFSWNRQLQTLLIIFTLPPQTSFLLYKWGLEGYSFTRSYFHDALKIHQTISNSNQTINKTLYLMKIDKSGPKN